METRTHKMRRHSAMVPALAVVARFDPRPERMPERELLRAAALHSLTVYGRTYDRQEDPVQVVLRYHLERLAVNYVRHALTDYDLAVADLDGLHGYGEALGRLRAKVYDAIRETYPELSEECDRQLFARKGFGR